MILNGDAEGAVTIMLAGDVMLGRGIDQILPTPSPPQLFEPSVGSALGYVALAERASGPIPRRVPFDYVWGDALAELAQCAPAVRIVNLETAVTRSDRPEPKAINYRMHPSNLPCVAAASIDCCVLANNHVLDWSMEGLVETLAVLSAAGIGHAGAGLDAEAAAAPAALDLPGGKRLLVYAAASDSSGVSPSWAAAPGRPGVNFLDERDEQAIGPLARRIARDRRDGDIVLFSIHWGPNWGYDVGPGARRFAHRLIEEAGVDVVHGHSSHHPKAIELHRGRPILYGCGDLINDYEGIGGEAEFRPDLSLIYLLGIGSDGRCASIEMLPFRIVRFQLSRASPEEAGWLKERLGREYRAFGLGLEVAVRTDAAGGNFLTLRARPE